MNCTLSNYCFADDVGWASTSTRKIDRIEKEAPLRLKSRNLNVNQSKTERYCVKRNGNEDWKTCKYMGSILGTEEDIKRRQILANSAYANLKSIFSDNQVSTNTKLRIFNALVESIFLYNSELWSLTKTLEDKIYCFQRRLLRCVLKISWSRNNWCSNIELYKRTNQQEWSKTIRTRRLRFFGHCSRLDDKTPVKIALKEAIKPVRHPRGRSKTNLLGVISNDLEEPQHTRHRKWSPDGAK